MAFELEKTEGAVERVRAAGIEVDEHVGKIAITNVDQMFKLAEALSRSEVMVPPHCRGKPGVVFALMEQAQEWGLPFLAVIRKSYLVVNRGVETVAFESQLVHTLIDKHAGLVAKLREEFIGEGDDMICRISGTFKGETKPHIWESEKLGKIKQDIGTNEKGQLKGSPLWITRPRLQLKYATTRDWARAHCPWVILGVYTPDEMSPADASDDVTPVRTGLVQRLQDRRARHTKKDRRGFDHDHVKTEVDKASKQEVKHGEESRTASGRDAEIRGGGGSADSHGGGEADEPKAAAVLDRQAGINERPDASGKGAETPAQGDIFPPDRKA